MNEEKLKEEINKSFEGDHPLLGELSECYPTPAEEFLKEHDMKEEDFQWPELARFIVEDAKKITKVEIMKEFTDDHCPCIEAKVTFDEKHEVGLGFWWLSNTGVKKLYLSEEIAKGKKALLKWIKDDIKEDY